MKEMNIINLNNICKVILVKKQKTDRYEWIEMSENISEWFKNFFRKNKIKKRYIKHWFNDSRLYTKEEFLKKFNNYSISLTTNVIYEKPHVILWYSDYNHGNETKYFETDKEANDYFNKLVTYAKQYDIPFINIHSEK
jgi:dsDNA-binding SOS-regulon protein